MAKEEITPSEWQIMEILWACREPLTSSEVYKRIQGAADMSQRMVRVLMNRLNQKNILGYTVDERDSRVYHPYFMPIEACPLLRTQILDIFLPDNHLSRRRQFQPSDDI